MFHLFKSISAFLLGVLISFLVVGGVFATLLPMTPTGEKDGGKFSYFLRQILGTTAISSYGGDGTVANSDTLDGIDSTGLQRKIGSDCPAGKYMTSIASDGQIGCDGSIPIPTTGICGTASGQTLAVAPSGASLCATGTGSAVSGSGGWSWTCTNVTSVNCSATNILSTYSWTTGSWSSCTANCDGGSQCRSYWCERSDGIKVADSYCSGLPPSTSQPCNTHSCSGCMGSQNGSAWDSCNANPISTVISCVADGQTYTNTYQIADPGNICNGPTPVRHYNIPIQCSCYSDTRVLTPLGSAVSGACGTSNGGTFSTAPAANLCTTGTPTSVVLSGSTWIWGCGGDTCGTNIDCSANKTVTLDPTNIYCWGNNSLNALGTYTGYADQPQLVLGGPTNFRKVSLGDWDQCAITDDNKTYCWGRNRTGIAGDGTKLVNPDAITSPKLIPGWGSSFVDIGVGMEHACGLTATGEVYCWGKGQHGRLGYGGSSDQLTPRKVNFAGSFTQLTLGGSYTCALTASGDAYCWGNNPNGVLGNGTNIDALNPTPVSSGVKFKKIVAGDDAAVCALSLSGSAYCWGNNGFWAVMCDFGNLGIGCSNNAADEEIELPTLVQGGHAFTDIVTTGRNFCGLKSDGSVYCWGRNSHGELGNGGTSKSLIPVAVIGGHTFANIYGGWWGIGAITSTGDLYYWGTTIQNGGSTTSPNKQSIQPIENFDVYRNACAVIGLPTAPPPPPSCGTANGQTLAVAPSGASLCATGTGSAVSASGSSFDWTCTSGSTVNCSAVLSVGNYCSASTPACDGVGCSLNTGSPTSAGQAWVKGAANCGFTCIGGYSGPLCATPPANYCSASTPACDGVGCSLNTGSPTSAGQAWVKGAANCGFTCIGGYSGPLCATPPANYCSASTPACDGVGCSLNTGSPTSAGQAWVKGAANCGFTCIGGYSGPLCATPPANYCSASTPACDGVGCSLNTGSPTSAGQAWVKGAANCGFTCIGGYSGPLCATPPANYCSASTPACDGVGCSLNTGSPTSAGQAWVKGAANCGFTCIGGYSGPLCATPPANYCSASTPACDGVGCSLNTGSPTSAGQAWVKGAANCGFTCINGYTGPLCATCNSSPSGIQPIACGAVAGTYGIPVNYTVGTAFYRTETAVCRLNYNDVIWTDISGCSAPAYSCSPSTPACDGVGCSLNTGSPTSAGQAWVKGAANCGFTCINGYTGPLCATCNSSPSGIQPIACGAVAGTYGIPVNYTVGTAFYRTETAVCRLNYNDVIWTDISGCSAPAAPIHGGWSSWGSCTGPCGPNNGSQSRTCTNPAPANGGNNCVGSPTQACTASVCAIIHASCSPTAFACSAGTLDPSQNEATPKTNFPNGCYYNWYCDGQNGGNGSNCAKTDTACFAPTEKVKTTTGEKDISQVKVGDKIMSYDEKKGQFVENIVDRVIVHDGIANPKNDFEVYPLLDVEISVNNVISHTKVTANHLYYAPNTGTYKFIGDFSIGESIKSLHGTGYVVSKTRIFEDLTVYNLHMKNAPNNYLVNGVVVHNEKLNPCTGCVGPTCNAGTAW